jgi:hypothetical protein
MIAGGYTLSGHYDDHGYWQRDKFCFVSCGDACDCGPPMKRHYAQEHDKFHPDREYESWFPITDDKATPANRWRTAGEPDPHAGRYDGERAALALGQYTDDELANGAFLNYDRPLDIQKALDRTPGYHSPIAWMTAVKDRIRWLSRLAEKLLAERAAGYYEVSASRRCWRGGDYNGSQSSETTSWRFPSRETAEEFIASGALRPKAQWDAAYDVPSVRLVEWDH